MAVAGKYKHRRTIQQVDALAGARAVAFSAFLIILFVGPSLENNGRRIVRGKTLYYAQAAATSSICENFSSASVEHFVCWSRLMVSLAYMAFGVMWPLKDPRRTT